LEDHEPGEVNMHLGNGAITAECVAITYGAAGLGLTAAALHARRMGVTREKFLLAAGLGMLVFAAQAINVQVWPGTSAHLVGGVLLAALLGPGMGALTMAVVLAVQALVLGDGGVAALAANVINMGLVPAGLVAAARGLAKAESPMATGLLAALAVPLAAGLIVVETGAFRSAGELAGWSKFAAMMLGAHLWIGVLEGMLTAVLVVALARVTSKEGHHAVRPAVMWIAGGIVLAAIMLPVSSALPDGYEAAAEASGMEWLLEE
jgi:cobalt/nickel transport system permease protein